MSRQESASPGPPQGAAVIVELKAVKAFDNVHFAQCINYLKATGMKVCLLINFGQPKIEIKRFAN